MPSLAPVPDASAKSLADQSRLYDEAATAFGSALARLAGAYERDPHRRQDLLQDIHFAVWRSLATFDGQCSLRTWVYRVAHNVATSHALRDRRRGRGLVGLEALDSGALAAPEEEALDTRLVAQLDTERQRARLLALIEQLAATDRQLVLLYLEGLDAAAMGEVTGLSPANVTTKIHRIKRVLARRVLAECALPEAPACLAASPTAATARSHRGTR